PPMPLLRSFVVCSVLGLFPHAASAACVIDRLRPTGTLPTLLSPSFHFVVTNNCVNLLFTVAHPPYSRVPVIGVPPAAHAPAGPDANWYEADVSSREWALLTVPHVTVF